MQSTRFQSHNEFTSFVGSMEKLEKKIKYLKEELKPLKPYTEQYDLCDKKLYLLELIYENFNNQIKIFNQQIPKNDLGAEKEEAFNLALNLMGYIGVIVTNKLNKEILEKPRNNNKKNANKIVHWGAIVGTALFFGSQVFTLTGLISATLGGNVISAISRYMSGLSDNSPESAKLVAEQCWSLKEAIDKLDEYLMQARPLSHMENKSLLAVTR